jgi:hypothetical protein
MFTLLGGHPHAVSLAAPLLADKSLTELYKQLNSNRIMDCLRVQGIEDSMASLQISLDVSINNVRKKNAKSIELFSMFGLLPGGANEEDLNSLWEDLSWEKLTDRLLQASLLVKQMKSGCNEARYNLLPFMNKHAESLLEDE